MIDFNNRHSVHVFNAYTGAIIERRYCTNEANAIVCANERAMAHTFIMGRTVKVHIELGAPIIMNYNNINKK